MIRCKTCDDTGRLARYGDKSKGEPHIVKSFCKCDTGKLLEHMCNMNGVEFMDSNSTYPKM